jgi:hypothetical protein
MLLSPLPPPRTPPPPGAGKRRSASTTMTLLLLRLLALSKLSHLSCHHHIKQIDEINAFYEIQFA